MELIVTIMGETKTAGRSKVEATVVIAGTLSINLAKLGLRGALATLEVIAPTPVAPPAATIPAQAKGEHGAQTHEIIKQCESLFATAIDRQTGVLPDSSHNYIRTTIEDGVPSQHIAIDTPTLGIVFLHRALETHELLAPGPYWLSQEYFATDAETRLPTFYYKDTIIDGRGNLQSPELLKNGMIVHRPLSNYDSQPYYEGLAGARLIYMVPDTELSPAVE